MSNQIVSLPADKVCEKDVLAYVMVTNDFDLLVKYGISKDYFFYESNQELYDLLYDLYRVKEPVTVDVVYDYALSKRLKYLTLHSLLAIDISSSFYDIDTLINRLIYLKRKRDVVFQCNEIIQKHKQMSLRDMYEVLKRSQNMLSMNNIKLLGDIIIEYKQPYKSGFSEMDDKVAINKGDLVIVCGRPSTGKSALMLSMALQMEQYKPVFYSVEMSDIAVMSRLISMIYKMPLKSVINNPAYYEVKLDKNIIFDFTARVNTADIYMKYVEAKNKYNSNLIFIDYLQLCTTNTHKRVHYSKNDYVGKVSADLKSIAKEMDIAVIAGCQLNRKASNERVSLADLRDSGEIEQNADVVIAIQDDGLHILKQRNGELGVIRNIKFEKQYCLWSE